MVNSDKYIDELLHGSAHTVKCIGPRVRSMLGWYWGNGRHVGLILGPEYSWCPFFPRLQAGSVFYPKPPPVALWSMLINDGLLYGCCGTPPENIAIQYLIIYWSDMIIKQSEHQSWQANRLTAEAATQVAATQLAATQLAATWVAAVATTWMAHMF